ncbi:uncharacterized protein LOC133925897 isoform X2 [Phragmites australis]|uniref:uncharacterized protein LOC133925897 isoform X2 n=1 Tax=Phragmites australis TaxID=29695 RepID=UPI002D786BEA|nr:uncharacterized protein LOC133925897 isoform X2 [Phragmites australis]
MSSSRRPHTRSHVRSYSVSSSKNVPAINNLDQNSILAGTSTNIEIEPRIAPLSISYARPDHRDARNAVTRDHFCSIVPLHIAAQNRRKRKRLNHFKALKRQASSAGISLYSLQDTFGSSREYTNFLKGFGGTGKTFL